MAGLCSKPRVLPRTALPALTLLPSTVLWHLSHSALARWGTDTFLAWLRDSSPSSQAAGGELQDKQTPEGCPLHGRVERALHGCAEPLPLCPGKELLQALGSRCFLSACLAGGPWAGAAGMEAGGSGASLQGLCLPAPFPMALWGRFLLPAALHRGEKVTVGMSLCCFQQPVGARAGSALRGKRNTRARLSCRCSGGCAWIPELNVL